jgi:polar amino acid transport system substrate-binding protein
MTGRHCASLVAAVTAISIGIVGCGSSGSHTTSGSKTTSQTSGADAVAGVTVTRDASIAATVPAKIRARGSVSVASDATYPPFEFIASDGKTVVGLDVDVGHAIGDVLGLKFRFVNATFATIIPGLAAGKYDVAISSMFATAAREKVVDMVTYYRDASSFLEKSSSPSTITSLSQLCGKTVAVESGTTEEADVTMQNARCKAQGKPGVTILTFQTQTEANLALTSGRAQFGDIDTVVGAYEVKQTHHALKMSGAYGFALDAVAVPKNSGMTRPIQAAIAHLIQDGAYKRILEHWDVGQGAISKPAINPSATTP